MEEQGKLCQNGEVLPFYCLYEALCRDIKCSPSRCADTIGFNRGTVSAWKKGKSSPSREILLKVAEFFQVPLSFLTQSPPFNDWRHIAEDRHAFLQATGVSEETLTKSWHVSIQSDTQNLKELIRFIDSYVKTAEFVDGTWRITKKYSETSSEKQDLYFVLCALKRKIEINPTGFIYHGEPLTNEIGQRLKWAIQLGLDSAEGIKQQNLNGDTIDIDKK